MCGFTIFATRKNFKNPKKFNNKKVLHHRGPDNFCSIKYKNIILNHWRLSIVDHSKNSNQPLENNKYLFAYNGEIYNYRKLSENINKNIQNSDTQFLFDLLNKDKNLNKIKKFSGFYSFVYLDKKKNTINFSRDLLGKKPLYYYIDENFFILSSEEKGIFNFIKKEVDPESIFEYFFYKHLHYDKTFFKNIKSIAPGSVNKFDLKNWKFKTNKTWENFYNESLFKCKDSKNFKRKFINTLSNSVKIRNICDVRTQLALSSGYDSTLILSLIKKNKSIINFKNSISIGFNNKNNESIAANKIAKNLNSNIKIIDASNINYLKILENIISYYDAPLEHPSSIGLDIICNLAKKTDKVLITGEGADDLLFGYEHYNKKKHSSFAFRLFLKQKELKSILEKDKNNLRIFDKINSRIKTNYFRNKILKSKFLSRELEIKTHMQTLLKRNDRISMKNSMEIRCPFLDLSIIKIIPKKKFLQKRRIISELLNPEVKRIINKNKKIGFFVPLEKMYIKKKKKLKNTQYLQIIFLQ